ncbi:GntR family transcriptional regulator [Agromyces sp. LHK192]|uniref:GntR family transcriptional regulator n=1 Tax=Agromyces sp. LHK192 TaxID=2498704 RepID=UPI001F0C8FA1|nr:GntR family transcriptional regulator [Agromyces sp. LHK192]
MTMRPDVFAAPGGRATSARDGVRRQVSATLRAALIAGELVPGKVYSAPELARRLDVSATPVREAMLDLARDRMVEVVPNTGFRVTEVGPAELDRITAIRLLLEVPVMGEIAESSAAGRDRRLAELRPLADAMVAAAEAVDLIAYLALDTEFHTSFLAIAGNDELVDLVRGLRERSRLTGLRAVAEAGGLAAMTREHHALLDAALAHDRRSIEELTRRHLGHVRSEWAADRP